MYVISPSAKSPEVKELVRLWHSQDSDAIASAVHTVKMGGKELRLPLLDVASVCALLVWQPADPNEPITRLLFPGSAPQSKILEGLEKFKQLECLKMAVCMGKDLPTNSIPTAPKSPTKAKQSSPRHSAAVATVAPVLSAAAPPIKKPAVQSIANKEKDNKEMNSARPATATAKSVKAVESPLSASRTGSGEIRVVKKTITAVATAKVAHKREPSKTRADSAETNNKTKKDAANNLKAVEAKVHSFKSPASMKRAAEEKSKMKANDPAGSAENAKENAAVKDVKERAMRSQSQSREKRSASSVRSTANDEEKKAKLMANKKNESTASPAKVKATPAAKPSAPKPISKPASSKPKPAAKETKPAPSKPATSTTSTSACWANCSLRP